MLQIFLVKIITSDKIEISKNKKQYYTIYYTIYIYIIIYTIEKYLDISIWIYKM